LSSLSPESHERRAGLARSLLLAFLPLLLALILIAGIMGGIASLEVGEARALDQLNLVAALKQDEIVRWLGERERDLAVLVGEPSLQASAARLLDPAAAPDERLAAYSSLGIRLNSFLEKKLSFAELFLLSAGEGRTVVSTDVLQEDLVHASAGYFVEGLEAPYLGPPEFDPRLNVPTILVARPLYGPRGELLGVLAGRVNLADLGVLMLQWQGLGETGETYLVDTSLRAVTRPRFGVAGQQVESEGVRRAVVDRISGSARYANYRQESVFGIYHWIPELQVGLLAEKSVDEALASRTGVLLAVVGISLLGAVLGTLVVVRASRRISRPLTRLTEVALEMAAGDLGQRSNLQRPDEIGALSSAFDTMAGQLQDLIGTLEDRVAERTQAVERRAIQLATAADVGRAAASILELEPLCREVVALVRERFDYYYAGLFLLDQAGEYAVLQAGTGEAGRTMQARGHKLQVGGVSMVGAACEQRQARIFRNIPDRRDGDDSGAEILRFDNPLLPETRSEVALPLIVGDRLLGALDVQSTRPFDLAEEEIAILRLVADQVAVAVDNARKFSQEAALLEATSPLYRVSRRLATALSVDEVVQDILISVSETEADGCAVGRLALAPDGQVEAVVFMGAWDRRGELPFSEGTSFPVGQFPLPLELATSFWTVDDVLADDGPLPAVRDYAARFGSRALVNIPLQAGGQIAGFVSIARRAPGPFSAVSLRLYETLVGQAAVALERAHLYQDAQRLAARERLIGEVTGRIRQTLDVDTVLRAAAREMREVLDLAEVELRIVGGAEVAAEASIPEVPEPSGPDGPRAPVPLADPGGSARQAQAPRSTEQGRGTREPSKGPR
jgi:GAF domain-containing protein/HAMP domain-containing protein